MKREARAPFAKNMGMKANRMDPEKQLNDPERIRKVPKRCEIKAAGVPLQSPYKICNSRSLRGENIYVGWSTHQRYFSGVVGDLEGSRLRHGPSVHADSSGRVISGS